MFRKKTTPHIISIFQHMVGRRCGVADNSVTSVTIRLGLSAPNDVAVFNLNDMAVASRDTIDKENT